MLGQFFLHFCPNCWFQKVVYVILDFKIEFWHNFYSFYNVLPNFWKFSLNLLVTLLSSLSVTLGYTVSVNKCLSSKMFFTKSFIQNTLTLYSVTLHSAKKAFQWQTLLQLFLHNLQMSPVRLVLNYTRLERLAREKH